jgi:hypothetical protein
VTVRRIRVSAGRTMTGDAALSNELTIEVGQSWVYVGYWRST